jgi:metal-sulfur cluster biosynthetic enzyme
VSALRPAPSVGAPTVDDVRRQLRTVVDPCSLAIGSPTDIVAMGLVEDVAVGEDTVSVSIVLTDVSCVFWQDLRRHVADALLALPGVESAEVSLATDVLWTPDRRREEQR